MSLSAAKLQQRANLLIEYHRQATLKNEWTFFVDQMYHPSCVYTCEYAGAMAVVADGIDEIKATHYGRDMLVGWEGWSFPYIDVFVGSDNKVITHWLNRGPGLKADGSHYQTPGVSFLTFADNGKIIKQLDMFDLAHQMKLCDELEANGLLAAELKENWVLPMKEKLIAMLSTTR
jgi:ketosteroid isomerase-like protein